MNLETLPEPLQVHRQKLVNLVNITRYTGDHQIIRLTREILLGFESLLDHLHTKPMAAPLPAEPVPPGPSRKFSDEVVREIRKERKDQGTSVAKLAKKHGVSDPTIYAIVTRQTYKDVPDEVTA